MDNSLVRDLQYAQGFLLALEIGLWSGMPRKMEIAESFLSPLLTMCRRGGKLRRSNYHTVTVAHHARSDALNAAWDEWIELESWKRLMLRMMQHDTHSSMSLLAGPLFSYAECQFPLPDARDCWMAPSAEHWKTIYLAKVSAATERRPSLVDVVNDVVSLHNYTSIIDDRMASLGFLSAAWGLVWEYLQFNSMHKPSSRQWTPLLMTSRHDELVKLLNHFRISIDMSQGHAYDMLMRLELTLMHLHMSFEDVQLFAGAEGPEEARRVVPSLRDWVKSPAARQTVWHAGQVIRAAKSFERKTMRGFASIALYHASLAFWVYGLLSENPSLRPRSGTLTTKGPESSRSPAVWLDEADTTDVQRFIQLDRGSPALIGVPSGHGSAMQTQPAFLDDPGATMQVVVNCFKLNFEEEQQPILVQNLIQLMSGLQSAAIKATGVRCGG
jgi:hypothetical protein